MRVRHALIERGTDLLDAAVIDAALVRDVAFIEQLIERAPSPDDLALFDRASSGILARAGSRVGELARVHRALRRIVAGEYGRCSVCARAIAVDRLLRFMDTDVCALCESVRRGARARAEEDPLVAMSRRCRARRARTAHRRRPAVGR
jgi:RNA polymerase-binding transcription factor DksA